MRRIISSDAVGMADSPLTSCGVIMSDGTPSLSCGVLLGDDDGAGDGAMTADGVGTGDLRAAANRAMLRGNVAASMRPAAAAAAAAPA